MKNPDLQQNSRNRRSRDDCNGHECRVPLLRMAVAGFGGGSHGWRVPRRAVCAWRDFNAADLQSLLLDTQCRRRPRHRSRRQVPDQYFTEKTVP